jgi:tRNA-2-methylthio-N6-dimethylallyladenosine synthase
MRALAVDVPSLKEFMKVRSAGKVPPEELVANSEQQMGLESLRGLKFYVETYGCQMNTADSEIVTAVLMGAGLDLVGTEHDADVVLLNTCAIRDNAENRIWERLRNLRGQRKKSDAMPGGSTAIGLLGCMAERLKSKLLEGERPGERPLVDFIAGPDAYRDLPRLLSRVAQGESAMNVQLSLEETYAEIAPVRPASNGVTAFLSITRGCNNMCSYCVVPFTRGRERSRAMASIVDEVKALEQVEPVPLTPNP